MQNVKQIVQQLKAKGNIEVSLFKQKKFGITATNALGITIKDLKEIAKSIPYNKALSLQLYDTQIYEAKLLCAILLKPTDVDFALAQKWIAEFDTWEICDTFCMKLFAKSTIALNVIDFYKNAEKEFEKRAAFAVMAAYTMANKNADNVVFENFLQIIINAATDERNFIKKAVNWALRNIGKRNIDLKEKAIATAKIILNNNNKAAQWIAKDALRELQLPNVRVSDYPRHIYRT